MNEKKVMIVDNNDEFRGLLKKFLTVENEIHIIGEASSGEQAITEISKLKPDIVIMDVSMSRLNGLDATYQIHQKFPKIKVIMLSSFDYPEYKTAAMENGATGYIVKKDMIKELIPAIEAVCLK